MGGGSWNINRGQYSWQNSLNYQVSWVEYDWYQVSFAEHSEMATGIETKEVTTIDVFVHSLWWSVVTITTVGYGDISPVSGLGKLIAMVCMLAGYGLKLYILIDIFRHYAISSDKD